MDITSKNLSDKLYAEYPNLSLAWMTDDRFEIPSYEEMKRLIEINTVANISYVSRQWACEEYALALVYKIRHWRNVCEDGTLNYVFGEVFGDKHMRKQEPHYWNIFLSDNKFYGVEPQTNDIWEMSKKSDNPILIKI